MNDGLTVHFRIWYRKQQSKYWHKYGIVLPYKSEGFTPLGVSYAIDKYLWWPIIRKLN